MDLKNNLILPGNPRYQPRQMQAFFGYDNLYHNIARVEIATMKTLHEFGVIPAEEIETLTRFLEEELKKITTSEVDEIERTITHHDIRAWVRKAQEIINSKLSRWLHIPLTSYDALDTARILTYRDAYDFALKPHLTEVIQHLIDLTRQYAQQIQVGRTHGQHALPVTVGFWLAFILNRLVYNLDQMDIYAEGLVGKISGAVGAYNAQKAFNLHRNKEGKTFEQCVLEKLELKPAPISTQILPPEPLSYFLYSCAMTSATLGQFGRDGRNLMRTEIAELSESFEDGQVGSSTMAHKRNPINFENLEGMWLRTKNEFGKVLDTLISDHQRDLVGSAVARDLPIILINLQQQLNTLLKKNKTGLSFIKRLNIDSKQCMKNIEMHENIILAEPMYIALQMIGYEGDAHELVNHTLVPQAKKDNLKLIQVLEKKAKQDPSLQSLLEKIPHNLYMLFWSNGEYTGLAQEKALEIAQTAEDRIKKN